MWGQATVPSSTETFEWVDCFKEGFILIVLLVCCYEDGNGERRRIRNLGRAVRGTAWPGTPESDIYALWMAAAFGDGVGVGESLCCLYILSCLHSSASA